MADYLKKSFSCVRDGMTIRGLSYIPKGDNLPIAIISHGFMANYLTTMGYAKWFAKRGYAAFCFDFNGGGLMGKSDKDTTKMTLLTEVADLKAVIDYAKALPGVDASNITLMGCSQGGVVSALTAAELQDEISKLVLFYPALCIPDDAKKGHMMFAKFDPNNIPDIVPNGPMKLGKCYPEVALSLDLIPMVSKYKGSTLIVHGTSDKIVDYKYAVEADKAYPNSKLYLIPHAHHMFMGYHDHIARGYIDEFIK